MATVNIEVYDERFHTLVGTKFQLEELFSEAVWAEGPAWLAQQQAVIFSDVKGNTMYRWTQATGTQVFRSPSNFANGNTVDTEGNLITCEHGRRAISKTDKQGNVQILVDKLEGKRLNSPNDVVVKSDGTIWFTDPPYGIISDAEGKKSASEIIGCYVYCYDPKSDEINIATFNVMRPNGLAFSADEKQLFVADMSVVEFAKEGLHHLVVFDVQGVIYCSCESGIIALLSDGTYLGRFILGKPTSNCTFGDDQKTLFITSSNSLYKLTIE